MLFINDKFAYLLFKTQSVFNKWFKRFGIFFISNQTHNNKEV